MGRVYVVRGHIVKEGTLSLPLQGPKAVVAQVVNAMEDATPWAELFAGSAVGPGLLKEWV